MYSSVHRVLYVQRCAVCTAVRIVCCMYSCVDCVLYVQQCRLYAVRTAVRIMRFMYSSEDRVLYVHQCTLCSGDRAPSLKQKIKLELVN